MSYDRWKTRSPDDEEFRGKPYVDDWDRLRAEYDELLKLWNANCWSETAQARLEQIEQIIRQRWFG